MKIKAILFDMDGVLMDSEYYYQHGTLTWMRRLGFDGDPSLLHGLIGTTMDTTYEMIAEIFDGKYSKHQLQMINEAYFEQEDPLDCKKIMFANVKECLISFKQMGIKMALCSASPMQTIVDDLKQMEIDHLFDCITSGEDFVQSKPDPAIYLYAMQQLGVQSDECIVYEDSKIGIEAGVASKAFCVAREDKRFGQDQSQADLIVKDIEELLEYVRKC
ncbi:MAG: HAD family phosphatase [Erysipelotrichaceae bacterium]|nr:HAD family phosphatase [Erysipelotrichaceae bacterium]MDY5252793.1 HAD family phosphatase [Erysipelotrichaceae bacterium]